MDNSQNNKPLQQVPLSNGVITPEDSIESVNPGTAGNGPSQQAPVVVADISPAAGVNATPVVPMKTIQVDPNKGAGKWIAKLFSFTGITNRIQADMQAEQAYAAQHGFTYETITQVLPTGPDGIGSAVLSADGATVFYHHISGILDNHSFDSIVWHHTNKTPNASVKNGVSFGIGAVSTNITDPVREVDTVFAGRVTIDKNVPSLIVVSKSDSLLTADPQMFRLFKNAGSVTLEGNFNQYFEVFAPTDDPVSAFQSLPPNFMSVLLDEFQGACIEFVGSSIYLMFLKFRSTATLGMGEHVPTFSATDNDMLMAKLQRLASFFDGSFVVSGTAIAPADVITDK